MSTLNINIINLYINLFNIIINNINIGLISIYSIQKPPLLMVRFTVLL